MARRRVKTTKLDIIRCATTLFLEQGYSSTSPKQIADELDIGTGNLTYYFPTKEHLLAVLVDMLCDYQWKMMEMEANEGVSSVMAICLELTTMAAACEADEAVKDFFLSAYSSPLGLQIIRKNDTQRAKKVFAQYCPDWSDDQFAEAELLASGIEYATLMTAGDPLPLQTRITGCTIPMQLSVPTTIPALRKSGIIWWRQAGIMKALPGTHCFINAFLSTPLRFQGPQGGSCLFAGMNGCGVLRQTGGHSTFCNIHVNHAELCGFS